MPTLKARVNEYRTGLGDLWDLISWKVYGDEHGVNSLMDANPDHRNVEWFSADIILDVPPEITVEFDLKHPVQVPNLKKLLPWR